MEENVFRDNNSGTHSANGVKYYINRFGSVCMVKPKTIQKYKELCDQQLDLDSVGVFWAFSDEQFDKGLDKLKEKGMYSDEDTLVAIDGGGFLPKKNMPALRELLDSRRQKKAECDPQEVYFYEYNECEGMYSCGEENAYDIVEHIFGKERASKVIRLDFCGNKIKQ